MNGKDQNETVHDEPMTGKVKWYSVAREYGFITRDDNGKDVYFRHRGIVYVSGDCNHDGGICARALPSDASVVFRIEKTERGLEARHIKKVGEKLIIVSELLKTIFRLNQPPRGICTNEELGAIDQILARNNQATMEECDILNRLIVRLRGMR